MNKLGILGLMAPFLFACESSQEIESQASMERRRWDQVPPTVTILSPSQGSEFEELESITIRAHAKDNIGRTLRIYGVELWANGERLMALKGNWRSYEYEFVLDLNLFGPGDHEVGIRAGDIAGNWSELEMLAFTVLEEEPPVDFDQFPNVQNYMILGNGWRGNSAPSDEIAYFVDQIGLAQEYRDYSGYALKDAGAKELIKYRLGCGAWPRTSGERAEVFQKITGEHPDYDRDIRMPTLEGGFMQHKDDFYLVDVVTPENRPVFRKILRESLEPFLTGETQFDGVFLDVAAPVHSAVSYPGQTPNPPGGYSKEKEQEGWIEVYRGLKEDFPGKKIYINGHLPWEQREPVDLTGYKLVTESGVDGIMSESRALARSGISGWTAHVMRDVSRFSAAGKETIVISQINRSDAELMAAQRDWALASFLISISDRELGHYGMGGAVSDDDLPEFPEMNFAGLGEVTSDLIELADGQVFKREFENGVVFAHVKRNGADQTITVPEGMEKLVLEGGGNYPSSGSYRWEPIEAGEYTLNALNTDVTEGSSLILRNAP